VTDAVNGPQAAVVLMVYVVAATSIAGIALRRQDIT
jgi:hypothetical protein